MIRFAHALVVLAALMGCAPTLGPSKYDPASDGAWCGSNAACVDTYQARVRACEAMADEAGVVVDEVVDERTHVDCVTHGHEHPEGCSDMGGYELVHPDGVFCVSEVM